MDTSLKVLVIDDSKAMRMKIIKNCKAFGFTEFMEASNAREAFDAMIKDGKVPGLILSDYSMPGSTGYELLKALRKKDSFKNTPFIIITADRDHVKPEMLVDYQPSSVYYKPFDEETLREAISSLLAQKAA